MTMGSLCDRNNAGDLYSSLSTLLQQQNEKLDLLIERSALDKTSVGPNRQSDTSKVVYTPPKQSLPIFQSSTSSLFCIGVIDTNLKVFGRNCTSPPPSNDRDTILPQATFSIVQGKITEEDCPTPSWCGGRVPVGPSTTSR
jgi:hypothetical protein